MQPEIRIIQVESLAELVEVKTLFQEYFDWIARELRIDMSFQSVKEELEGLPGAYASPKGSLLLATLNDQLAGCIALRPQEPGACEMKRMVLRPECHGHGIGHALCAAIIREAKIRGYTKMRLDTEVSLRTAQKIYAKAGFRPAPAYYQPPEEIKDRILFFALELS